MTHHGGISSEEGIERKLDRIMEELRTPTAIGYSVRRGQSSKGGLILMFGSVGRLDYSRASGPNGFVLKRQTNVEESKPSLSFGLRLGLS